MTTRKKAPGYLLPATDGISEFLKGSLLKMSNAQLMVACDEALAAIAQIEGCVTLKKPAASDFRRSDLQAQIDYARVLLHRRLVG
jgi:hypothetical protein